MRYLFDDMMKLHKATIGHEASTTETKLHKATFGHEAKAEEMITA